MTDGTSVLEDGADGAASVTVTRSGDLTYDLSARYATEDMSAVAGADYTITSGTLVFPAGVTTRTVVVPLNGQSGLQDDRQFRLRITHAWPRSGRSAQFQSSSSPSVGLNPAAVITADLNYDRKPDLITANASGNSLSVLVNTSIGAGPTFAAAQTFLVGLAPRSVTTADLNGDGKPDLAAANSSAGTVSVLLNTTPPGASTITFATALTLPVGNSPISIASGDFNRDGRPDLAAANSGSSTLSVLLNTTAPGGTTAAFAEPVNLPTGAGPVAVLVADLNADGVIDLASADRDAGAVSIFYNLTAPGASAADFSTGQQVMFGGSPSGLQAADLDFDRIADLAVVDNVGNLAAIALNRTAYGAVAPAFDAPQEFPVASGAAFLAARDVDGDGLTDLLAPGNGNVTALVSHVIPEDGTLDLLTQQVATGIGPGAIVTSDFDNDGRADLALANAAGSTVVVLRNTLAQPGPVGMDFAVEKYVLTQAPMQGGFSADMNADGRPDVVGTGNGDGQVHVYINAGAPGLTAGKPEFGAAALPFVQTITDTGIRIDHVALGDLDGDALPDVIVSHSFNGLVSWLVNATPAGAMEASFRASQMLTPALAPEALALADVNGDGRNDLMLSESEGTTAADTLSVRLNATTPGASTVAWGAPVAFAIPNGPRNIRMVDINNDGRLDIVVSGPSTRSIAVLLNTTAVGAATPSFREYQEFPTNDSGPHQMAVADINRDGRLDVLTANPENVDLGRTFAVFRNTTAAGATSASFAAAALFDTAALPLGIMAADVDRDGIQDVVVGDGLGAHAFINRMAPGATTIAFAEERAFPIASCPCDEMESADLDLDGQSDLMLSGGGISILFSAQHLVYDVPGVATIQYTWRIPDAFTFPSVFNAPLSSFVYRLMQVSGTNAPAPISVTGGEYEINGSGGYTAAAGWVDPGATVWVRVPTAATHNTMTTATLTIGGVSANFSATTIPAPSRGGGGGGGSLGSDFLGLGLLLVLRRLRKRVAH